MPLITLKDHQTDHVDTLLRHLTNVGIGIDTSGTGAGKTFSSLFIAQSLGLPIALISPKSISLVWETLCRDYDIPVHSISSYALVASRRVVRWTTPVLAICDEFHYLKNDTKRFQKVRRLLSMLPEGSKVLLLSATPYDKESNATQMIELYKAVTSRGCYKDVMSAMAFRIPHTLTITKGYYKLGDEGLVNYRNGVDKLHRLHQIRHGQRAVNPRVVAGLITNGTTLLHDGTFEKLMDVALQRLETTTTTKLVIIAKYIKHLDAIAQALAKYGVVQLDGRTKNRLDVIARFQEPNTTCRVIVTSAQVGGIGVNLDDQHGGFPREMFILPSYECIDLIQCVGRIHRTSTKSKAKVTLINSSQIRSPIESNIQRKIELLETLTNTVEKFTTMDTFTEE